MAIMAKRVELRKKISGSFSGDTLMLPKTHIKQVIGLLDSSGIKLSSELIPEWLFTTKKFAGVIAGSPDLGTILDQIDGYNGAEFEEKRPGSFVIASGKVNVGYTQGHFVQFNDDGEFSGDTVSLENGDHLFYINYMEYTYWDGESIDLSEMDPDGNYPAPYNTINKRYDIFATKDEMNTYFSQNPRPSIGKRVIVTGYKWVTSTQGEYAAQTGKLEETVATGDLDYPNYYSSPTSRLWNWSGWNNSIGLRLNEPGVAATYWKLVEVDDTMPTNKAIGYTFSEPQESVHVWGVVNNTYELATSERQGLMSAQHFTKLEGLFNYTHPTQGDITVDTSGVEVLDKLIVNTFGHVTTATKRTLPPASTGAKGVIQLATAADGKNASEAAKALTPSTGKNLLDFNQTITYYASGVAANADVANVHADMIAIIDLQDDIDIDI